MKRLIALLLIAVMAFASAGCKKNNGGEPKEFAVTDDELKGGVTASSGGGRVFYEIFVGSFSDSDGDGIGDLRGIINRMDYLNDGDPDSGLSLGVEGIWLSPIFTSPSYHKYDVTDYYTVDPQFGTEADLKELLDLCHERNVKVILDLVINHTGKLNAWYGNFVKAHRSEDTESEYYDLYSWYDKSWGAAPAGRSYAQVSGTDHYVECNFSNDMPELNFDSPYARALVLDVARHYLALGVDGFRFDAAKYVYFGDNQASANFWKWYIDELKKDYPDMYTVAEVWDADAIVTAYYRATDCFDFEVSGSGGYIAETAKKGDVNAYTAYVQRYLDKIGVLRPGAEITPFITNHDMDRAAGFLTTASGAMQMAANLYILGPGTPFIYYGEELGMRGSRGGANTDANRRLAMLWGDGDTVTDPKGSTYSSSNQITTTAADQMKDSESLFNYYKRLIMIRKANPAIALGTYTAVKLEGTRVGGFIAEYNGEKVLVIHNTTGSGETVDLSRISGVSPTELRAVIGLGGASLEGNVLTIDSQTSVVLR